MNLHNKKSYLALLIALFLGLCAATRTAAQAGLGPYGAYVVSGDFRYGQQEDTPFAMHSVMKFPQALYVAEYLRLHGLSLSDSILVCKDSLETDTWSPMLATWEGNRHFSFAELLQWSLVQSDNNACDMLFAACGMPQETEAYLHALGFKDIHIRLTEKELKRQPERASENACSPREMARLLEWLFLHRNDNEYLAFVWDTMAASGTGLERVASVVPKGAVWVHKTGSGFPASDGRQDRNDVGIIIYPDSTHMTISLFVPNAQEEKDVANIARASIMRIQADRFLHNMPADLQHRQTLAILQALDGDFSDLTAVRNARNARPQYADNVDTRMIAENMRIYEPKGSRDRLLPVLLYLHGGGWTFGSINSCGRFCNAMAASGATRVVVLDYRLAPEFPYPDGLNDCVRAVEYLTEHAGELRIDSARITLGGDSSGGNLALATALTEACRGKIESLLLFYPVTKAYPDGSESWELYGKGFGLDEEIMVAFNRAYTLRADARSSSISVGLCSDEALDALPRTLLVAAERDILRDQGKAFAERMGNKARRIEYEGSVHLFITVPGQDAAFEKAVSDALEFITAADAPFALPNTK